MDETGKYFFQWDIFKSNLSESLLDIKSSEEFFDVTLVCGDEQLKAHKIILAASSPWFRSVLSKNPHTHPLIYLKGIKFIDLKNIVNFLYKGEVSVPTVDLKGFREAANDLKIKHFNDQNHLPEANSNEIVETNDVEQKLVDYESEDSVGNLQTEDYVKVEADIDGSILRETDSTMNKGDLEETLSKMVSRIHHGKLGSVWECKTCKKFHKNKTKITQHAETHLEGFKHKCKMCGVIKKTRKALQKHIGSKHKSVLQNE
jgi:hypothetical protein